jgi:hypothetical protein
MGNQGAPIDELVNLLARDKPSALAELQRQYPAETDLLSLGKDLGPGQAVTAARCAVALQALDIYTPSAEKLVKRVRARLRTGKLIDLISKIATFVGSGAAALAIFAKFPDRAMYLAIATAAGSILGFIATYLVSGSPIDKLLQLSTAAMEARASRPVLAALCAESNSDELEKELNKANELAHKLNDIAIELGSN